MARAQQLVPRDVRVRRGRGDGPRRVRAATIRGRCLGDGDGDGDSGLEWDGASGFLYLTDRLPRDGPGEIAYFRAPAKFLGDKLDDAYNATLAYELYLAGGGDPFRNAAATPTTPHGEFILIFARATRLTDRRGFLLYRARKRRGTIAGCHPRRGQTEAQGGAAPVGHLGQALGVRVVQGKLPGAPAERSLEQGPARANRGGVPRHAASGLGIRALRVPHYPRDVRRRALLRQLQLRLDRNRGMVQHATIPQGFGWSDVDPGDRDERGDREARDFVFQTDGTEYVGKAGAPYDPFAGVTREQLRTAGPPESRLRIRGRRRARGATAASRRSSGNGATAPPCQQGQPDLATVLSPSRRRRGPDVDARSWPP